MLHITKTHNKIDKKTLSSEVFVGVMLFSIFFTSAAQASDITANTVIDLVNRARNAVNIATLKKNDLLQQAAEKKAQDMIDSDYFAHISPKGVSPWDWIEGAGYNYRYAGENLAINYINSEDQQDAWMASPTHKKNILNTDYQEIGVAVKHGVIDGHQTTVTVQEFGTMMAQTSPVAATDNVTKLTKPAVAGAAKTISVQSSSNVMSNIDSDAFYKNNKMAIMGWFGAFAFALMIVVVDAAALIHKKHGQILMFHAERNRH